MTGPRQGHAGGVRVTLAAREQPAAERFDTWCLVELMGHRRIVARVSEQTIAGHGFLRLDEPAAGDSPGRTQLVSPAAVYALHPMTEELALGVAARWRSTPVTEWDLPEPWRKAIASARTLKSEGDLEQVTEQDSNDDMF